MDDERLRKVMAAMAAGDRGATFDLYAEFGGPIRATVRRLLRRLGVDAAPAEDLDGLVIDACLELQTCAEAWDPEGGAKPWVWAERRLLSVVSRWVGQHADTLEDRGEVIERMVATGAGASSEPSAVEVLDRLDHPVCLLLREALEAVATDRDRLILLEVGLQRSLGDASPAVTVGPFVGLRPDAVRQVLRRVRQRVSALAVREPRFEPLVDLALLAV
jgi:DNA-directed RNA polymerase specialized sigma24 family protein